MTPDERERMNRLCVGIQEERDYTKFATLLREMGALIERKEQRRFKQHPHIVWQRTRPWVTAPAVVRKVLGPLLPSHEKRVEIAITTAETLFQEVRIENRLTDLNGHPVALKEGARLDVTFEADPVDTTQCQP